MQVTAVANKDGMLFHRNLNIQISRRPAMNSSFAFAGKPNSVAIINASRHFHRKRLGFLDISTTVTNMTGILDGFSCTLTARAGLLHRERPLTHTHLPHAITGSTVFRCCAFLGPAAVTGFTKGRRGNTNFDFSATHCIFKAQGQGITQVCTALNMTPATAATAKNITENITKDITEALRTCTTALSTNTGMAKLIISVALFRITKDFIGLVGFLEKRFRLIITRITIRMMLHGNTTIGLL